MGYHEAMRCFSGKRTGTPIFAALAIFSAGSGAHATPYADIQKNLVPHKALYEIKMVSKKSGSQIVNVEGKMFFEWRNECDAWVSDHRFDLNYEYAESPPLHITSDFSTYESFDGTTLNFTSRRYRDGEMYEELRGSAERAADGTGTAVYSLPDGLSFNLPAGSLFPMWHTMAVLQKLKEGKKFFPAVVFDGSDQDGPMEINTFAGKETKLPESDMRYPALDKKLLQSPAHSVRMAFFLMEGAEEDNPSPAYEMTATLHDNGIISRMQVEYGDFTVVQKLVALEKRDVPLSCEGIAKKGEPG